MLPTLLPSPPSRPACWAPLLAHTAGETAHRHQGTPPGPRGRAGPGYWALVEEEFVLELLQEPPRQGHPAGSHLTH